MRATRVSWRLLATACVALVVSSCDNGPLEKAGKAVDRAGEKAGDKIKDVTR